MRVPTRLAQSLSRTFVTLIFCTCTPLSSLEAAWARQGTPSGHHHPVLLAAPLLSSAQLASRPSVTSRIQEVSLRPPILNVLVVWWVTPGPRLHRFHTSAHAESYLGTLHCVQVCNPTQGTPLSQSCACTRTSRHGHVTQERRSIPSDPEHRPTQASSCVFPVLIQFWLVIRESEAASMLSDHARAWEDLTTPSSCIFRALVQVLLKTAESFPSSWLKWLV